MVKTRQKRSILAKKRDERREERERISPSVRAERLAITKQIAQEIVCKQEDLRGSRYGCRVGIIRHYSQIYSWLNPVQIDWHVRQIRKRTIANSSVSNDSNYSSSNENNNLVVNESTVLESNEKTTLTTNTVSPTILKFEVDCWGGEGTSILDVPRPRRIIHLGLAAS